MEDLEKADISIGPRQCWECLKRRLVCDFGRPGCKKCLLRKVECPGYGSKKPVTWLQPGQTRSKGRRARMEAGNVQPAIKDWSETTAVLEATRYYNANICPDLAANGAGGGFRCPFTLHLDEATYVPASARHTIVSIALAHRILKSEPGFEGARVSLCKKLQVHRGEALRHLATDLKPDAEKTDYTLTSILTLLLAEIQQSFSASWRQHCDAANAFIDMSGGMIGLLLCRPFQRPLVRYFLLIEILSLTTTPAVDENRVRRQMDIFWLYHEVFGVGLHTSVPCPPALLINIVQISNIICMNKARHILDNQVASIEMLKVVESFSVEEWAIDITHYESKGHDPKKPFTQRQALSWDWQAIGQIYKYSVVLYCISSLLYPHYTERAPRAYVDGIDIEDLRSAYLELLLCGLKQLSMDPKSRLRKFVTWPLVIAGIEVNVNDAEAKDFICQELLWISKTMGMASPLVAERFLTDLWKSDWMPTGYGRPSWNSIFDRPYVFMM